jgi:hypothetical protein
MGPEVEPRTGREFAARTHNPIELDRVPNDAGVGLTEWRCRP